MAKYTLKFQEEIWYDLEVEAASENEAIEKFWKQEVDLDKAVETGREFQENVEAEENN